MITVDDYNSENYRLAEIAVDKDIQGEMMFFIDFRSINAEMMVKRLADMGCQIGSHTINHKNLTHIDLGIAKEELKESKKLIESLTGRECSWLAYPFGAYNNKIIEIVKEVGYKYARVTHTFNFDSPYEVSAMHIGRLFDEKCGGQNSYEMAKRTNFKHFYTHYIDLFKDKKDSFEQMKGFMDWYAKNRT